MGTLYLVSTPIGNLSDITLRAIEVLQRADVILCEDTRHTGILLKRIKEKLTRKLVSFQDHNEEKRIPQVLEWLRRGQNIALVCDAGTPLISDPGYKLVRRIRELENERIKIEVIPGPSAVTAALTSSGFPPYPFLFLGYLPRKIAKRKKILQELQKTNLTMKQFNNLTMISFESPYRVAATLKDFQEIFGDIEIAVCRELTKLHEEVLRGKVHTLIGHFEKVKPKGEITLVWGL